MKLLTAISTQAKRLTAGKRSVKAPKSKPKVTRDHKSFRLTKRADYARSLKLPGYLASAIWPWQLIWRNKKLFASFILVYSLTSALVVGLASQESYTQVANVVDVISQDFKFQGLSEALTLALAGIAGGFAAGDLNSSGAMAVVVILVGWLTVLWLVRALMRNEKPRLRDGLYSSGAPIVPVAILGLIGLVQLIPAALATLVLRAGITTGYITTGIEGMLIAVPVILAMALSLYWLTTTVLSIIVVTLPGMYPLNAHRHAFNLIRGRRLVVVLRFVWLLGLLLATWLVVLTPIIAIERALSPSLGWLASLPIVPLLVLLLTSFSLLYSAVYSYQLYRCIVDHDAS